MLKVTQQVWGRGRFDSESHDLWHFTLALDCASEAAKYPGFVDHILLGLSSVSAPSLLLPSSVLLHSTQPCNPETPLVQPFPHVWNGLFACLTPWWDKMSQMAKIGVTPIQNLNSSHSAWLYREGAQNEFWECNRVFLGALGYLLHGIWYTHGWVGRGKLIFIIVHRILDMLALLQMLKNISPSEVKWWRQIVPAS